MGVTALLCEMVPALRNLLIPVWEQVHAYECYINLSRWDGHRHRINFN